MKTYWRGAGAMDKSVLDSATAVCVLCDHATSNKQRRRRQPTKFRSKKDGREGIGSKGAMRET
jgi:hypothetical protein